MKRTLALLMMLGVAGAACASAPPPADGPAWAGHMHAMRQHMEQRRMHRLTVLLDLTPAQQAQVKGIFEAEHARMHASRRQVRQAMQQAWAARKAAHHETMTRLSAVLSPEQMKKLALLMPRHMHMGPHHWTGGAGMRADEAGMR